MNNLTAIASQGNTTTTAVDCSFSDCKRASYVRGLCPGHYAQLQRGRKLVALIRQAPRDAGAVEVRFWSKVVKSAGCWEWTGFTHQGYGRFWDGKHVKAHRFSYELAVGPIPAGLQIDHLCRNRACVRPDHLEAVTQQVNMARGEVGQWIAAKAHCPQGHPYSGANLCIGANGSRSCRACNNANAARYRARRDAKDAA